MTKTNKLLNLLCLIFFLYNGSYSLYAQENKNLIDAKLYSEYEKYGLTRSDISDYLITDQYTDRVTGLTYAYIQQRHNKIAIYNAISVFVIKDNKVVYFKPQMIDHLAKKIKTDKPSVTAEAAIGYALIHLGRNEIAPVKPISTDVNTNTLVYQSPGISSSPIKVQLVYRAMDEGVYLAWDVSIEMKNEPHWWNVRIDALTGAYLDKNDFVASCNFDDPLHNCSNHIGEINEPFIPPTPLPLPLPPVPAEYTVFPFPIEAPSFGSRSLLSAPSDNVASPFGWHDDNGVTGAEYTITRGNNVYAYEDANNDNLPGYSPNSGTLQFNYPLDLSQAPLVNQDASITNLFYDCNRIHDVLYHSGFTETAGNFQQNNYGNGGLGNDKVLGEAFDGSGTNNANFATPADGSSGRMQMYLWTAPTPDRDGSFDNGIVAHEYGHGLSNRLTGGPSQAGCLGNAEQGGEGWSDWLALIMTTEPQDTTGGGMLTQARGIGTYALNQATNGAGIRRYRYSVDMAINPQTYANLATSSGPHQKGEIWCDAIWDMTSFLINDLGFNSDPTVAAAGNNIAMRLVLEGMKLQPCSPGYIDGRDAILLADNLLYADAHRCRIWEAFARRGMGFGASQGSSNSSTDQTVSFALPPFCLVATQPPVAGFTNNISSVPCAGAVAFTDTSIQAHNWFWDFGDQTSSTQQNPTHIYNSPGTYSVKLVVTNPLGSDSTVKVNLITVTPTFSANVTATPNPSICGSAVQLNAAGTGSSFVSYNVSSIPYAPLSGTPINVALSDDAMSSAKPIGFPFNFYGQTYSNFYICSNGFISFSAGQPATPVYGQPIPSTANPNNLIALAWNDLEPTGVATAVSYFNTGFSPNQKLVIQYNTRHFGGVSYPFVVQAILSEGSNEIEIHTSTISNASAYDPAATTTQGVENAGGTSAVTVPGRNGTIFSATNDAYRFTPFVPYSYTWQPGNLSGATQTVNPVANSTYTVNVSDGGGCVASFSSPLITVNPLTVVISGSPTFCAGSFTTLDAGNYGSYNWSTGATTQTITVNTAGTYTVSVSNINGCTGSASLTTSISSNLNPSITGNTAFCAGSSTILDGGIYAGYLWSTGETTQTISVNTNATFTVTVNDGSGCTGSASVSTSLYTPPLPAITGNSNLCVGGSTLLTTGLYAGYSWSTGATTQSISVNTAGTFTVTVTDANGCTASATASTTFYAQPVPVITGNTSICTGTTTVLDAGSFNLYLWSTGSTNQTVTVSASGTYSVTVSDVNGCTGTASVTIVVNPLPNPTITGSALFCPGDLIPLDAGAFISYNWSTGATTQIATVSAAGTYTVTVTDGNGCTKTVSHTIVTNTIPSPPLTGDYTICQNGSVPGGQGLSATITVGGSFTNENKFGGYPFASTGPATVFSTITVPAIPSGAVLNSAQLKLFKVTALGNSFRSEFRVALTGSYSLSATQVSTLTSAGVVVPDPVINLPGFPQAGGTINLVLSETFNDTGVDATVDSAQIDISYTILPTNITWWDAAAGGNQVGTGTPFDPIGSVPLPNSTIPGNYTFYAQANSAACNSTRVPALFNINPAPAPSISGNTAFCAGGSSVLDAGVYSTYLWSTGASTQSITINTAGTFTVTVTSANGCTGSASVTTTAGSLTPNITGTLVFCTSNGTTLDAGAGYTTYSWSNGASTQTIFVNNTGTYTVTVSDALGCTGSASVSTTSNLNPAPPVSGGDVTVCTSELPATLVDIVPLGISVNWYDAATGGNLLLANSATFVTSIPGTYYNEAIDPLTGCVSVTRTAVTLTVNPNPAPPVSGGDVTVCASELPATLVDIVPPGINVNWYDAANGGNLLLANSATFVTSAPGTYYNEAIDPLSGCVSVTRTAVTLTVNPNPAPPVSGGDVTVCANALPATLIDIVPFGINVNWWDAEVGGNLLLTNSATYVTSTPGTYYNEAIDPLTGCVSISRTAVTLTVNPNPVPVITGVLNICTGNTSVLDAGSGYSNYNWSTGATTQTINVNTAGTFTVTVTDGSLCQGSAAVTTTVNPVPVVAITGPSTFCATGSANLSATAGYSTYAWSNGATTQNILTNIAGTYTVTVTNAFGCTTSTTKSIAVSNAVPPQPGVISGPDAVCLNGTASFSITPVAGATSYTWSAGPGSTVTLGQGTTNATISFNGFATPSNVSVIANNACGGGVARLKSYSVSSVIPAKPSSISGPLSGLCTQSNVAYSCPLVINATSYLWTVPAGVTILTGQGTNAITVKFTGAFTTTGTISVVAQSGCGNSAAQTRTLNAKPGTPAISGQNWACKGQAGLVYSVAPVAGASSYTWTPVAGSTIVSGQGTTTIVYNWGSINGVIYCKANNACGSSLPASKPVAFTCKEDGSLLEISEMNLYPNPTTSAVLIQFEGYAEGKAQLTVHDLIGQVVLNKNIDVVMGNNNHNLDLTSIAKGIYTVKVTYNNLVRNSKLIVQ